MNAHTTRSLLLAMALLAPGTFTGCATAVGAVAGPITGPITFWRHTHGVPGWVKPLLVPFAIPVGPLLGAYQGAAADIGFVANGEYGVRPDPPFEIVFDPTNTALDGPALPSSDYPAIERYAGTPPGR